MKAAYTAARDYVLAEQGVLGDKHEHIEQTQNAQVDNFLLSLGEFGKKLADSKAALTELGKKTKAFTTEQRAKMASAVSAHMRGETADNTKNQASGSGGPSQQKCYILNDLLTKTIQQAMCSKDQNEKKVRHPCQILRECLRPSEP